MIQEQVVLQKVKQNPLKAHYLRLFFFKEISSLIDVKIIESSWSHL